MRTSVEKEKLPFAVGSFSPEPVFPDSFAGHDHPLLAEKSPYRLPADMKIVVSFQNVSQVRAVHAHITSRMPLLENGHDELALIFGESIGSAPSGSLVRKPAY